MPPGTQWPSSVVPLPSAMALWKGDCVPRGTVTSTRSALPPSAVNTDSGSPTRFPHRGTLHIPASGTSLCLQPSPMRDYSFPSSSPSTPHRLLWPARQKPTADSARLPFLPPSPLPWLPSLLLIPLLTKSLHFLNREHPSSSEGGPVCLPPARDHLLSLPLWSSSLHCLHRALGIEILLSSSGK